MNRIPYEFLQYSTTLRVLTLLPLWSRSQLSLRLVRFTNNSFPFNLEIYSVNTYFNHFISWIFHILLVKFVCTAVTYAELSRVSFTMEFFSSIQSPASRKYSLIAIDIFSYWNPRQSAFNWSDAGESFQCSSFHLNEWELFSMASAFNWSETGRIFKYLIWFRLIHRHILT